MDVTALVQQKSGIGAVDEKGLPGRRFVKSRFYGLKQRLGGVAGFFRVGQIFRTEYTTLYSNAL